MRDRLRAAIRKLKRVLTPEGSLMERSVTGGIWVTALNVSGRGFQILTMIFLARLLSPRAFGIVGIGMVLITGLYRVSKLGLDDAMIYNEQSNVDEYLNTTWLLNGGRGIVIASFLFVGAPFIANFFSEPSVTEILRVMAIGPLVFSLKNPAIVYFKKDLQFHKQFAYEVSGDAAFFVVAFAYALVNPSPWALAFGYISKDILRAITSYLLHGYRPWPSFETELAKELINYGKWITGASIANFISQEGDDLFVGWLLSASALGFYQMAFRLSNAPATEVTHVISRITFPAYSEVQDDMATLRSGFYKTVRISVFIVAPMAVGIAVVTPTFVRAFLGQDWVSMIIPMQILALYGLLRGFTASFGSVWRATGNPDYLAKLQVLTIILMAIFIYPPTARWGITGAALAVTGIYLVIMLPLDMYLAAEAVDGSIRRLGLEFLYPFPATAFMGAAVLWTRMTVDSIPLIAEFVLLVCVGIVSYLAAVAVMELHSEWGILNEIRDIRNAL